MHLLLRTPRTLAAYLLAWLLAGGALAAAWARLVPTDGIGALAFWLPLAALTGVATLAMYAVCRSRPLRPARWISAMSRRGAAVVLLALLVTGASALWNATGPLWGRAGLVTFTSVAWLSFAGAQVVVFALSAQIHDALLAHQIIQAAMTVEAEARLLARESEIKALRRQLDPHFLFNSLNSISSLIHVEPAAARAMTIDLARFFRLSLGLGERERIRLDEELDLVRHYLAIEQRRLGDKLRLSIDADDGCRQAWLPPLVLQPLMENAIKHGIRPLDLGGLIELAAVRAGDRLTLRVSNPVDVTARRDASGLGQGLRHLQQRLQAQYDEPTSVDVDSSDAGRYTVRVSLPWQT